MYKPCLGCGVLTCGNRCTNCYFAMQREKNSPTNTEIVNKRFSEIEKKIDGLEKRLQNYEEKLNILFNKFEDLNSFISAQLNDISNNQIKDIKQQLKDLQERIDRY